MQTSAQGLRRACVGLACVCVVLRCGGVGSMRTGLCSKKPPARKCRANFELTPDPPSTCPLPALDCYAGFRVGPAGFLVGGPLICMPMTTSHLKIVPGTQLSTRTPYRLGRYLTPLAHRPLPTASRSWGRVCESTGNTASNGNRPSVPPRLPVLFCFSFGFQVVLLGSKCNPMCCLFYKIACFRQAVFILQKMPRV